MIKNQDVESVRSVISSPYSPYKMWEKNGKNGIIKPFAICELPEAHSASRQSLPKVYLHNGCIDIIRSEVIIKKKSMVGDRVLGYFMDKMFDIDNLEDFKKAAKYLNSC